MTCEKQIHGFDMLRLTKILIYAPRGDMSAGTAMTKENTEGGE